MMKFKLIIAFLLFTLTISAQDFYYPVSVEMSHPYLVINKVSFNKSGTEVELSVSNNIDGGWFCADKNISLVNKKDNKEYKLIRSENIPTCPDRYEFKKINEKLIFKLYFDKVENLGDRIDIVENCSNNCFFFKGVILNNKLNVDIHKFEAAVSDYESGNIVLAEKNFIELVNNIPENPTHVYGFSFSYLYKIEMTRGNTSKAGEWKKQLLNSSLPNKEYYLANFTN